MLVSFGNGSMLLCEIIFKTFLIDDDDDDEDDDDEDEDGEKNGQEKVSSSICTFIVTELFSL